MEWPVLRGLGDEDRRQVLREARRRTYDRGMVIFHEGDPGDSLHLLARGRVAIRITTELGEVVTLTVLGAGEVFGELALIRPAAKRTATVVALEDTETLALHRDQFEALRRSSASVDRFLIEVLAAGVVRLSGHLVEALYVKADKRVLRRLHSLTDTYGGGAPGTVIPLTHEELARMAGTTRPTANRVLHTARKDGLVRLSRNRVEVVDPAGLARAAR
jgi:CRP/FNR family transcriptional regulator, cyclic AMP receptor protein